MTDFSRKFRFDRLTETVLQENSWFTDLLRRWHPAGDAANSSLGDGNGVLAGDCVNQGELRHLRAAFRGGSMNFYCGGQSIAKVNFGHRGLQAKIHGKYVYGLKGTGQKCVTLTSKEFPAFGTGQPVPYGDQHLQEWIASAQRHIGHEKRFVDLIVAHNRDVIDLEMGLPAYIPEERRAPRMDLVALEPHECGWRVVLWEVKLVADPRLRCEGDKQPEVLKQLEAYTKWLRFGDHENRVAEAYQQTCRLLVKLHAIAKCVRPDIEELGPGIQAVAKSNATPPSIDVKPRLLIIYDKNDKSFIENGHLDKLMGAGLHVKIVKSLNNVALCEQL